MWSSSDERWKTRESLALRRAWSGRSSPRPSRRPGPGDAPALHSRRPRSARTARPRAPGSVPANFASPVSNTAATGSARAALPRLAWTSFTGSAASTPPSARSLTMSPPWFVSADHPVRAPGSAARRHRARPAARARARATLAIGEHIERCPSAPSPHTDDPARPRRPTPADRPRPPPALGAGTVARARSSRRHRDSSRSSPASTARPPTSSNSSPSSSCRPSRVPP